jgi:hypothetical protein
LGLATGVTVALLLCPTRDVAQTTAAARLVAARSALRAGAQLDSVELMLREVLDSAGGPTRTDRVEAWLLVGVARYYGGNDSGVAAAFREALALEPQLAAPRLAQYDSSLVVVLEAQQRALLGPAVPVERVTMIQPQVCAPACPKGVTRPRLRFFPTIDWNSGEYDPSMAPRDARLVVRYIVDTTGHVDTLSIRVVANNFPPGTFFDGYTAAYLNALAGARYDPARAGTRPVSVIVESVLRFRVQRGGRIHGLPVGRDF